MLLVYQIELSCFKYPMESSHISGEPNWTLTFQASHGKLSHFKWVRLNLQTWSPYCPFLSFQKFDMECSVKNFEMPQWLLVMELYQKKSFERIGGKFMQNSMCGISLDYGCTNIHATHPTLWCMIQSSICGMHSLEKDPSWPSVVYVISMVSQLVVNVL